ncbi:MULTISPECIES: metalloregulator ArsR/SmtB family transcription factor [unclassified Ruegeria]|uniref:ArsR/SmtB family transcription factor n=1 Tax=unclassified Ruegeria TaxID=2625375 RepID=UPI001ADA6395|nr:MULTISPECIES: metalloregulator ArsR/SmtB family transcription factor [unclassified Ruegeria]MBO9413171.1 winged helix-turn-helix transcriptional regulator [Ruegeria sp. R8_1]MBO9416845.1 winged helix-turn-helix transcriptional regulator [Ruegeria sp. R8_2]
MSTLLTTFSALSDATRFSIVEQLMQDGELPAGDLIEGRGMSGAAISRHLKLLREAGLINQRVQGSQRMYSIRPEGLRAIAEWTISKRQFWESSLDRLGDAIERENSWPT